MSPVQSLYFRGVRGYSAPVEVSVGAPGAPQLFKIVGMSEAAVREARVRVQSAIMNAGFVFPSNVLVTLPEPPLRSSLGMDLPIALGILLASHQLPNNGMVQRSAFIGELSLGGDVRPVRGVAAMVEGVGPDTQRIVCSRENAQEALLSGLEVVTAYTLGDIARFLKGDNDACPRATKTPEAYADRVPDMADVYGQVKARRAMEIAAAGGHSLLLKGLPGAGKTMLARRFVGLLPPMTEVEARESTKVASVAGLNIGGGLRMTRPFRAPHHTTSAAGLIGGGSGDPRPGELSLAHGGVLYLDEVPEFHKASLEVLAGVLRDERPEVELLRYNGTVRFPAKAHLVGSMSPCPCGSKRCSCELATVSRYRARAAAMPFAISVEVEQTDLPTQLAAAQHGPSTADMKVRVDAAIARRKARQGAVSNAELNASAVRDFAVTDAAKGALQGLSAEQCTAVLRVARTIADLDDVREIDFASVAEAAAFTGVR